MLSTKHPGSQEHKLASSDIISPAHAPQRSPRLLATIKAQQLADEWKQAGLRMTEEATPLDVHASLDRIHSKFRSNRQISLRSSILKTAVASVADGCTSESHYTSCLKAKYGRDLVEKHDVALRRFISMDMKDRGTYGIGTKIKGGNGKWFADDNRARNLYAKLKLPPVHRIEPPIEDGDVAKYHEHIRHLDPFQLSVDEYIKHGFHPLEQEPHRWSKRNPKKAMKYHLRSKNASEEMVAHFKQVYKATLESVSIFPGGRLRHRQH